LVQHPHGARPPENKNWKSTTTNPKFEEHLFRIESLSKRTLKRMLSERSVSSNEACALSAHKAGMWVCSEGVLVVMVCAAWVKGGGVSAA
jgi:hypothetical protein